MSKKVLRTCVELIFSLLPFRFVMKLVGVLLSSQGFGSGARVRTSGELKAARLFLGDDVQKPMTIFDVGANRGEYTSAILELYPRSRIWYWSERVSNLFRNYKSRNIDKLSCP